MTGNVGQEIPRRVGHVVVIKPVRRFVFSNLKRMNL